MTIHKYPRTRHLEGSRLQPGDSADDLPLSALAGAHLVIEEKLDGANCAVSFDSGGALRLQSRGHFLAGGGRERQFDLLKTWAGVHAGAFWERLGDRYVMYGEWLYAKHTVFYDALPHYFMEFDVLDTASGAFLATPARRALLAGLPVTPVPVLKEGGLENAKAVSALIRPSLYKTPEWREALAQAAAESGSRPDYVRRQTEDSDLAEGLYVKHEVGEAVEGRYKFVRADFLQAIEAGDGHWRDRPILPNRLREGVDLFAPTLGVEGAYDDPTL